MIGSICGGIVLGDDQVQHEHDQEGHHQAAAKDIARQLGHELQDIGGSVDAKTNGQRDAHDHPVAVIQRLLISSWMPDMVMAANTVTVAPPSTGWGMVAIRPLNLGKMPAASMMTPTMANTRRATTLVVQIRPTFWL